MNHQDAIIELSRWTVDEQIYMDFIRLAKHDLSAEEFEAKWKDHLGRVSYALHPKDNSFLIESDFVLNTNDVAILKAARYSPLFWHQHDFYEIVYVLNGRCDINFDDEQLHLKRGDFLMLAPRYSHQIGINDDETIALNIIIRSSTLLDIFLNAIRDKTLISRFLLSHTYGGRDFKYLLFHTNDDSTIQNYVLDIYIELKESDEYSNRIATSLITILFTQVVRRYSETADMPVMHRMNSENAAVIMNYIIDHYADCTLESISDYLHFSTQYTSRFIKSAIGLSFSGLLTEIRLQKAKNLLVSTPMKIDDISEHLGYANTETLIRVFKRMIGVTPSAYRREYNALHSGEPFIR